MESIGITIFECEKDEEDMFNKLSTKFGIVPTITKLSVEECNDISSYCNKYISVGHKSTISKSNLMDLHKAGVKYICTRSVGFDHIDIEAAFRMGITVENTEYSPHGVADYTIMLMLMAIRNTKSIVDRAKRYDFRLDTVRGKEIRDMTVGVVGTGRIGKAVMNRLEGFGCTVMTYSHGQDYTSLCELLKKSDIITLHVPLNKDTYYMIGRDQIEIMKQGAFLINTGRGKLVDTNAVIEALENGKLGGVALDVLEGEEGIFYFDCSRKHIGNQLLLKLQNMSNAIITPHTAYYTEQSLYDIVEKTILNCLNFERSQNHE